MELSVSDGVVNFNFKLERRLSFVMGKSATGKTTFYDLLVRKVFDGDEDVYLSCEMPVVLLNMSSVEDLSERTANALLVVDDLDLLNTTSFMRHYNSMVERNTWFLIMSREEVVDDFKTSLTFSTRSLYKLELRGRDYFLSALYEVGVSRSQSNVYDCVIVEDEKAGYQFFSKLYKSTSKVISSRGKNNIVKTVQRVASAGAKSILVIFDNASFGSCFEEFYKECTYNLVDTDISMLSTYECFEELLANTTLLRSLKEIGYGLSHLEEEANKFSSWERYFEYLVQMATENKPYRYRHKGKLRPCYIESCSKCSKQLQEKCDYVNKADAKIEGLLRGTKYEGLLS